MKQVVESGIEARKTLVQARSQATVEAIFEAALQVLLRDGLPKLTTTRVGRGAGCCGRSWCGCVGGYVGGG